MFFQLTVDVAREEEQRLVWTFDEPGFSNDATSLWKKKIALYLKYTSLIFAVLGKLRLNQSSCCEKSIQLSAAMVRRGKGQQTFTVHWRWEGQVKDSGPCAIHSPWKAWFERQQTSLRRKDGVHFYKQDNNKRPHQRGTDVSFLPNEAPDNCTRIKRPL